jgi:hypothetical protein
MAEESWIWVQIKKLVGTCAAASKFKDIKASVENAQGKVGEALMVGEFLQKDSGVFEKLKKANEGLGKVSEALNKAGDVCLDIEAVNKIHQAVVLLETPNIIRNNPEKAAAAFDSMFQGFGRLCRYLPPPADEWQTFFEKFNLFGNMAPKLIPELRWKDQFSQIDGWK